MINNFTPVIVGYDFFSTFDMPVIAGRVFDRDRNDVLPQGGPDADLTIPGNIVIDRAYAAQLGFASPEEAVDAIVYPPSQFGPGRPSRIIGVVENRPLFLRGLGATANAYALRPGAGMVNQIVRLSAADVSGGLAAVEEEEAWRRLAAAKNREIVAMLLRDFSKPVIVANLIAWPLAFVAAQAYLSIFIQRIALTPLPVE